MKTTALAVTLLLLLMNVSTNAQYNYIPFTQPAEIYKKAKVKIKLVTYEYSIVNTGIPATTVYNREGNVVESYFFDSTGKKVSNHVKTSYDSLHRIQKTDFENYTRWDSTNKKLEILEKITDSNNYQTRYYYYDAANRISKICYKYFKSTDTHTIEFNYPDNETMIVLNDYPFLKDHNMTIETYKFEKPFVLKSKLTQFFRNDSLMNSTETDYENSYDEEQQLTARKVKTKSLSTIHHYKYTWYFEEKFYYDKNHLLYKMTSVPLYKENHRKATTGYNYKYWDTPAN